MSNIFDITLVEKKLDVFAENESGYDEEVTLLNRARRKLHCTSVAKHHPDHL